MASYLGDTFAAFESRLFRVLWTGTFLAFIAFFMSTVVQGIVAFDIKGNNEAVGLVVLAQGVAQLLLNPLGGALADRLSKRMVILACQIVITVCFFALALLVITDRITIGFLFAGSFLIGAAFSFLGPARQGLMVELVGPMRRGNAIALSQVALNASRIAGPLLAAATLGIDPIGAAGAYALMGAFYVAAMVCTYKLPATKPAATASSRSIAGEIWTGLVYVRKTPRIRTLIPSYILVIMVGFSYTTVLPGLVEHEMGRKASQITFLLIFNAIGGLIASLGVASLADSKHAQAIYTFMCFLFGAALAGSGLAPGYWWLAGVMFFVGAGGGGFQTLNGAIVSHLTDPAYFGRVMSLTFLAFAASSIFAFPVGLLADQIGERAILVISGAVVCAIVAMFALAGRFERAPAPRPPSLHLTPEPKPDL